MASRNKDERAHVNALVKAIQKNSPGVYVYIDRDAGTARHTSSGFDFIIAHKGRVAFCEAKLERGRLSSWQKFIQAAIASSGTPYLVVRFLDNDLFTINAEKKIAIMNATVQDFIK